MRSREKGVGVSNERSIERSQYSPVTTLTESRGISKAEMSPSKNPISIKQQSRIIHQLRLVNIHMIL